MFTPWRPAYPTVLLIRSYWAATGFTDLREDWLWRYLWDCRDGGNGDVLPGTGNGSRTDSGKGVAAGVIGSWVSSYCDAPQFLQNFADGGTTSFPHS
jgi:hypothetical protein